MRAELGWEQVEVMFVSLARKGSYADVDRAAGHDENST